METFGKTVVKNYLNRFTLIIGDLNRGKTTMTQQILETYCSAIGDPVTVIDLAPDITAQDLPATIKSPAVGGRLQVPTSQTVRYFNDRIHPPRLRAKDEKELATLAEENARTIEVLFEKALVEKTAALFINDCSLYLHAGNPAKLLAWIRSYQTAVVNGYYGHSFAESRISLKERTGMEFFIHHCDQLIQK